jgi:hypothetical protein
LSHDEAGHTSVPLRMRPLLLVDVDGVVSLFGFGQTGPPPGIPVAVDGIPHWLSESAGKCLLRLSRTFECVWCTGWEERAEEHLPRLLGLPGGWPHLVLGEGWKLAAIDTQVGAERPVAWIDDVHDDAVRSWAAAREGPTLLVTTDPAVGITDEHVRRLEAWANGGH